MTISYPFYVIKINNEWKVSCIKRDITHPTLWKFVSRVVAINEHLNYDDIVNLPYCQHRGRVVDNKVYIGNIPDDIRKILICYFDNFELIYDEHENMIKEDVDLFNQLLSE